MRGFHFVVGDRVRHKSSREKGTILDLLRRGAAIVKWDNHGAHLSRTPTTLLDLIERPKKPKDASGPVTGSVPVSRVEAHPTKSLLARDHLRARRKWGA